VFSKEARSEETTFFRAGDSPGGGAVRRLLILLLGLACCLPAAATTTISGNVQNTALGLLTKGVVVRFEIRNCGNNRPRVIGVTDIVQPYFDFRP
jgi:hypothetical protein